MDTYLLSCISGFIEQLGGGTLILSCHSCILLSLLQGALHKHQRLYQHMLSNDLDVLLDAANTTEVCALTSHTQT